jgi:hypothetical protein
MLAREPALKLNEVGQPGLGAKGVSGQLGPPLFAKAALLKQNFATPSRDEKQTRRR